METKQQFDKAFYDDHIWGAFDIDPNKRGIDTLKLERLIHVVSRWQGLKCLEVGCGVGRYLRALDKMLPQEDVYLAGTDISVGSIERAKQVPGNIAFELMTSERIPWDDDTFDIVCFLDVLEHIESPEPFLTESLRVLKPGGVLHASVPLEGDRRSLWRWLDVVHLHDRTKRNDGQIQRFTRNELKRLFHQFPVELENEYYSYHLVGNVLDVTLFTLLNVRRSLGYEGSHYDIIQASRGDSGSVRSRLVSVAESMMYLEGRLLGRWPGPNAHFTFRKWPQPVMH